MTQDQEYTHARAIGAEIFGNAEESEIWQLRAEIADLQAQNAALLAMLENTLDKGGQLHRLVSNPDYEISMEWTSTERRARAAIAEMKEKP